MRSFSGLGAIITLRSEELGYDYGREPESTCITPFMRYADGADSLLKWAVDNQFESSDFYWKNRECYPMALGYFLRAACAMAHRFPKNGFYRDVASQLSSRIQSRSNLLQDSQHHHWGLPFPWPTLEDTGNSLSGDFYWDEQNPLFTGPLPAHCGYGVTTAIVGQGLLDFHELTGDEQLPSILESVGRWCLENCGYRRINGSVFFNYAPNMRHEIYNGSALVAAFIARAGKLLGNGEWIELAESAMELMADVQDEAGGWPYSRERREIEYHYGYNLESMAIFHDVKSVPRAMETLRRGTDYYREHLIDPDGRCYDDNTKTTETRLWAYGWAVSAFCHVAATTDDSLYLKHAETVADYMNRHLWDSEAGAYKFKRAESDFYMRDEAHAAYGLALLTAQQTES